MTGVGKLSGEVIALRDHGRILPDAGASAGVPAALGNVIPFLRRRAAEGHAPEVVLPIDLARLPTPRRAAERARLGAFTAIALCVHVAILLAFWREPEPLVSIGVEVISAEIVFGATAPAGVAQTPGEQLEQAAGVTDPQPTDPQREAEQKATEQPQNVEVARTETAPEQTNTLERQADERLPDDNAAAPREDRSAEPKPAIAMVESPSAEMATAAPREIPPDTMDISLLPQAEEKPVEQKSEPKPVQVAPPKPVKHAVPAPERRRIEAPTRKEASKQAATTASSAPNNVGVGRSNNDTNYRGIVWAHLARYKQPAGGSVGRATVSFTISGSGSVSSVHLVRASGVAAVDQEAQAMVRRASPFPPPPSGRSESFTVPVGFQVN